MNRYPRSSLDTNRPVLRPEKQQPAMHYLPFVATTQYTKYTGVRAPGDVQGMGSVRGPDTHPAGIASAVLHQPVDGELQRYHVGREEGSGGGLRGAYDKGVRELGIRDDQGIYTSERYFSTTLLCNGGSVSIRVFSFPTLRRNIRGKKRLSSELDNTKKVTLKALLRPP